MTQKNFFSSNGINQSITLGRLLCDEIIKGLTDPNGRVRAEEVISAAATLIGEQCFLRARELETTKIFSKPGLAVFSEEVNELLVGETDAHASWIDYPPNSVCGFIRPILVRPNAYDLSDLCPMVDVFQYFAKQISSGQVKLGTIPLSIPVDHHPHFPALKVALAMRKISAPFFSDLPLDKEPVLKIFVSATCLATILLRVCSSIDKKIAIRLAMETMNATSKIAPFFLNEEAMSECK